MRGQESWAGGVGSQAQAGAAMCTGLNGSTRSSENGVKEETIPRLALKCLRTGSNSTTRENRERELTSRQDELRGMCW